MPPEHISSTLHHQNVVHVLSFAITAPLGEVLSPVYTRTRFVVRIGLEHGAVRGLGVVHDQHSASGLLKLVGCLMKHTRVSPVLMIQTWRLKLPGSIFMSDRVDLFVDVDVDVFQPK